MHVEKHWIIFFALSGYALGSYERCGQNVLNFQSNLYEEGRKQEIRSVVGENYTSSAIWQFDTLPGQNFTVTIDQTENGLSGGLDCLNG